MVSSSSVDCIVIGAGIFGSVITKKLRSIGMEVAIVDNNESNAGSKPAACIMKPSWYSSLGKEVFEPAMAQLRELYTVEEIEFEVGPLKTKAFWIDPTSILEIANPLAVRKIHQTQQGWEVYFEEFEGCTKAQKIIIAAGIWCNKILSDSYFPLVEGLSPRTGTAFKAPGQVTPKIFPYAPYRQAVKFNINANTIWVGDGTANKNYTKEQLEKSRARCAKFIDQEENRLFASTGHRPYVKDAKPCYLKEHAPGLWVVTGGAKNGTIAAGWAAHKLGEALC